MHAEADGDRANDVRDGLALVAELLAEEGHDGRRHGDGRRDAGEVEQPEPHRAEDPPAEGQLLEHDRHRDEAEVERARLRDLHRAGDAEEGDGSRDRDRAAEHDLGRLVGDGRGDARERDVVLLGEVRRVRRERPHADGEREEDLAGGGEPDLRRAEPGEVRPVDELEALQRRDAVDAWPEREHADHEDDREAEQDRHADLGELLDAARDALREDVDRRPDREEEEQEGDPELVGAAVRDDLVGRQVVRHLRLRRQAPVVAGRGEPRVGERPRHQDGVVAQDDERDHEADHAEVLGRGVLPDGGEHAGHVALAVAPAVAPDAPLDPHQRDAEQQEGGEVRDHERAAAVGGGLPGEAEEVAEPDGVAGHGEDEPDAAPPGFSGLLRVVCHVARVLVVAGDGRVKAR